MPRALFQFAVDDGGRPVDVDVAELGGGFADAMDADGIGSASGEQAEDAVPAVEHEAAAAGVAEDVDGAVDALRDGADLEAQQEGLATRHEVVLSHLGSDAFIFLEDGYVRHLGRP